MTSQQAVGATAGGGGSTTAGGGTAALDTTAGGGTAAGLFCGDGVMEWPTFFFNSRVAVARVSFSPTQLATEGGGLAAGTAGRLRSSSSDAVDSSKGPGPSALTTESSSLEVVAWCKWERVIC